MYATNVKTQDLQERERERDGLRQRAWVERGGDGQGIEAFGCRTGAAAAWLETGERRESWKLE